MAVVVEQSRVRQALNVSDVKTWLRKESKLGWRYGANLRQTIDHRRHRAPLTPTAERVLADLRRDGIAMVKLRELTGRADALEQVRVLVDRQTAAAAAAKGDAATPALKPYLTKLVGSDAPWPVLRPLAVWFAGGPLMGISDHYFGMRTGLADVEVWRNDVTGDEPVPAQLWHRDMADDHYVLKCFVYLDEVDEGRGPLTYAAGTHRDGALRVESSARLAESVAPRSTDDEIAAVVPRQHWITGLGPAGTVVLFDGTGYHKGGHCTRASRTLLYAQFGSQVCRPRGLGRLYDRDEILGAVS